MRFYEIFNFILCSVDTKWKGNIEGYAYPDSEPRALKIWNIADTW